MTSTPHDLGTPDYAGPGVGITDTCGICRETFELMYDPAQYPTVANDVDLPFELICDSCQEDMEDDREAECA